MSDQKPYTPTEIDDTEDRMGSMEPLDFDQRRDERKGRIGDRAGRGNRRSVPAGARGRGRHDGRRSARRRDHHG